ASDSEAIQGLIASDSEASKPSLRATAKQSRAVIASDSEAIQSRRSKILDCFVASAPRNDGLISRPMKQSRVYIVARGTSTNRSFESRGCHCERSEAIQSRRSKILDCFVASAPRNDSLISRPMK